MMVIISVLSLFSWYPNNIFLHKNMHLLQQPAPTIHKTVYFRLFQLASSYNNVKHAIMPTESQPRQKYHVTNKHFFVVKPHTYFFLHFYSFFRQIAPSYKVTPFKRWDGQKEAEKMIEYVQSWFLHIRHSKKKLLESNTYLYIFTIYPSCKPIPPTTYQPKCLLNINSNKKRHIIIASISVSILVFLKKSCCFAALCVCFFHYYNSNYPFFSLSVYF